MKISGLIGDPVEHSVSPVLFKELSELCHIEYSHVKIRIPKEDEGALNNAIVAMKDLNFVGFNVTLPYKMEVIKYLDEIDESARSVGAVNTVVNRDGRLIGYNTDEYGAINTIEQNFGRIRGSDNVVLFGAGGASRAVLSGLQKSTKNITVFNRSKKRLKILQGDLSIKGLILDSYPLSELENHLDRLLEADLIINATSVGMHPNENGSIIPSHILSKIILANNFKGKKFFDVVFNPVDTEFLKQSKKILGAEAVGGLQMMIYQGVKAFELWTGHEVPDFDVNKMEAKLKRAING
jgi:shikimate dehydrogenase